MFAFGIFGRCSSTEDHLSKELEGGERESFLLLLFEDVVCRIFESSDKYLTCEQLPRKTCKHVRDTSLSLSSLLVRISIPRGNEIARYRLSIDPPVPLTLSRNNGRINLPEARDHSYRDHSVRKSKRFPAKKEEGETNLFFPLGGNFTARFNESMGRFGSKREKTDIAQTTPDKFLLVLCISEDSRIVLFSPRFSLSGNERSPWLSYALSTRFSNRAFFRQFLFVRAARLPRDTWPSPDDDLPQFTPLAEPTNSKATEKIKGRERELALRFNSLHQREYR